MRGRSWAVALAAFGPLFATTATANPAWAPDPSVVFYWCNALPAGAEMAAYQSRIYRQQLADGEFPDSGRPAEAFRRELGRDGVWDVGIVNCLGPFETAREAANDRALKARLNRLDGWTVFTADRD
ncbi:MAG: hypothetical protein ACOY4K_15600 [Pseudomonadota bacterium]